MKIEVMQLRRITFSAKDNRNFRSLEIVEKLNKCIKFFGLQFFGDG